PTTQPDALRARSRSSPPTTQPEPRYAPGYISGVSGVFNATLFAEAAITLIVIMDPPGTIPVFLTLVGRKAPAFRARAAFQAVLASFLVISLFALAGQAILAYLGIGVP